MALFDQYMGKIVKVEISGGGEQTGFLVDVGADVLVFYTEKKYYYIQLNHIKNIEHHIDNQTNSSYTSPDPIQMPKQISFEMTLTHALGQFIDIYVSDNQTINGYVLSVQKDFILFYSPLYRTMFIPLYHLKWINPYQCHQPPYALKTNPFIPVDPLNIPIKSTFRDQIVALIGQMVIFDSGLNVKKIGLLQQVKDDFVEIMTAEQKQRYYNVHHIKNCISPF